MTTPQNSLNSLNNYAQTETKSSSTHANEADLAVDYLITHYNARAAFFADEFIKKVREGNRKALADLQRHAMPPTQMDLRQELTKCVKANVADDHVFSMNDGKHYTMLDLKRLVPEWASMAVNKLMESDPAMADRLMSPAQWNAKSAFEVIFASARNELRDLKKIKQPAGTFDYYQTWVLDPLLKAIETVKAVNPPPNTLIGYGDRISLSKAIVTAEKLGVEFQKLVAEKTR